MLAIECPSTTSVCFTSSIWRMRSMPTSCGRGRTCGWTGSRTKVPTRSRRRSWPRRTPIKSVRRAPNLLIVSSNGAGYDPVDVEACTEAGVVVVNQSGGNAHSVAEHALAMLLTLSKRIIEADRALRRDPNVNRNALIGSEAGGKTIGIVGLGNVGRRIAVLCKGLLGMNVLAYDPYLSTTEMA